ncbi:MAG: hypothetical protein U5K37_13310 [Natrialbaceae archaeon]|nr:hypothetical protein [Natrialbaceae archaeon]
MALAGPRLDRPSAIGDEGRPRAASVAIASLIVLVLGGALFWSLGEPTFALAIASTVGFAIAGVGLLQRTGFSHSPRAMPCS